MKIKNYYIAGIGMLLFLLLILLLKTVDVTPSGAAGTNIGLSTINNGFHALTGVNMVMYTVTNVMGYVSVILVGIFGMMGLIQWIKRKELLKVDREILAMGAMFLILLGLYIFFEKVIINYRPILMPESTEPEASFPSSHTIMTVIVLGSVAMIIDKYLKNPGLCRFIKIAADILIAAMIIGRAVCGVHWLTDILGAVLMSAVLLELFDAAKQ